MQPRPFPRIQPKTLTILGSTGSIGQSTAKLIAMQPERFHIQAITANNNAEALAAQARALKAKRAVIANEARYAELKAALQGSGIEAAAGKEAVIEAAKLPSDIVLAAVVGAAGLLPTLAAIERGATIALANKECLVCAGSLMMDQVRKRGATLIPVDSEHSAIFQVFDFEHPETIEKIILTASGGPFREFTRAQMRDVTPAQAVKHPKWSMGAKISVDSATMMNKGLEIIEAYHLFALKEPQIEVIIHPESIIHSMVSYIDGSVLAQLGTPDMCTPIAYALAWPERMQCPSAKLDFATLKTLTFEAPDPARFPALRICREVLAAGGNASVVLNAANEIAVERFLKGAIGFTDIHRIIETALERIPNAALHSIANVVETDLQTRILSAQL